jgi:hypothetical protein
VLQESTDSKMLCTFMVLRVVVGPAVTVQDHRYRALTGCKPLIKLADSHESNHRLLPQSVCIQSAISIGSGRGGLAHTGIG